MSEEMSKFIVIIRPDFMRFCKDACRAASFNHLLFRIAGKCKDQPKAKIQDGKILWYANNEQITEEMSNAWGVCKVRQEINDLITMGLIGRTKDPAWGVNRTKHFFFGTKQCETFLHLCQENNICFVHLDLPDEVKHLIYSSNANDKSIKCICEIHQMQAIDISDANDISIEAITKIDNKEIHKEDTKEREDVATATARSQPSSQKEVVDGHTHQHPAMDRDLPANSHQPKPSQPVLRQDTNKITEPRKPRANSTLPQRSRQQGLTDELPLSPPSKPVEPLAEMAWGTRKCLQWFDYWRGGTLIAKYKLQQAASCAKGLAEQFDEKTVIEIRTRMAKDPFWIERGGPDVCEVANNIHKEINKKQPSNEHKATQQPANAFIERCLDKDYNKRKLEEMREKNALKRQAQAEGVQS